MYPEADSKTSMRMHWEIFKNVAFGYRNNEIEIYKQLVYVASSKPFTKQKKVKEQCM